MKPVKSSLFVLAVLPLLAGTAAAQDAFLLVPDIPGDSAAVGHEGWIDLVSLGQAWSAAAKSGNCDTFVTKRLDRSGPSLWFAAVTGTRFPEIKIDYTRAVDGRRETVYQIKLGNARITNVATSGAAGGDIVESVGFAADNATLTVQTFNNDGSKGPAIARTIPCSSK
jgi:type VI secretion system Hcp family effector